MNSQEAIILMMAQKLKTCDEQEMRQLCSRNPENGTESSDAIYQTLERWAKLDRVTQHKILDLLKSGSVRDEVHKLKAHISRLMDTQNNAVIGKDKGQ